MNEYRVTESTLNPNICGEEVRDPTIKMSIQETFKILNDINAILRDFAQIVNGEKNEDKVRCDASSLWDEARMMVALAYDNLQKLNEIKRSII